MFEDKAPRTEQEINQEFGNCCAKLGHILFEEERIPLSKKSLMARLEQLNAEMDQLKKSTEVANASASQT